MDTIVIILGIFFALSFLASIVVISACALSSQISQELEGPERSTIYAAERQVARDSQLMKDSATA